MSFITGEKSVTEYEAFFDRRVPQDMELVHYLNTHGRIIKPSLSGATLLKFITRQAHCRQADSLLPIILPD